MKNLRPGHITVSAFLCCGFLLATGPVTGIEKTLQNDSFSDDGDLVCVMGFVTDEIGAARFSAEPGDYPFTIKKIQVILCPDGPPLEMVLRVWEDDGSSLNPGASLYSEFVTFQPSTTLINEVDLTLDDITVDSGSIRVGIEFFWGGSPPGLARDIGDIINQTNFIYAVPPGSWLFAENLGLTGDWIIRVVIEANDPPPVFTDGFESGDASVWSGVFP